jgi:hypothetical protein
MKFKYAFAVLAVVVLLAALPAAAADLTGSWKSSMTMGERTIERTFVFKQEGSKLTGKIVSMRQGQPFETEIKSGKVDGDSFEFTVEQPGRDGSTRTVTYKGKVSGDKITGTFNTPQGDREWTATKQTS